MLLMKFLICHPGPSALIERADPKFSDGNMFAVDVNGSGSRHECRWRACMQAMGVQSDMEIVQMVGIERKYLDTLMISLQECHDAWRIQGMPLGNSEAWTEMSQISRPRANTGPTPLISLTQHCGPLAAKTHPFLGPASYMNFLLVIE